jgi:hypothetical protein
MAEVAEENAGGLIEARAMAMHGCACSERRLFMELPEDDLEALKAVKKRSRLMRTHRQSSEGIN